jgi:hypothetical protein
MSDEKWIIAGAGVAWMGNAVVFAFQLPTWVYLVNIPFAMGVLYMIGALMETT